MTYMHTLLCRVSPTIRIAARLRSPTLLKALANTRTLRVMRVSSGKVVSNGCALYVSYPRLCAERTISDSNLLLLSPSQGRGSKQFTMRRSSYSTLLNGDNIPSHPRRNACSRTRQARTSRPPALGRPAEAVQDGRTFVPGARTRKVSRSRGFLAMICLMSMSPAYRARFPMAPMVLKFV